MEDQPDRDRVSGRRRKVWTISAIVLVVGAAAGGYWLLRPADSQQIYQSGLTALKANDLGAIQVAAEALAAIPDSAPYVEVLQGAIDLRSGRLPARD